LGSRRRASFGWPRERFSAIRWRFRPKSDRFFMQQLPKGGNSMPRRAHRHRVNTKGGNHCWRRFRRRQSRKILRPLQLFPPDGQLRWPLVRHGRPFARLSDFLPRKPEGKPLKKGRSSVGCGAEGSSNYRLKRGESWFRQERQTRHRRPRLWLMFFYRDAKNRRRNGRVKSGAPLLPPFQQSVDHLVFSPAEGRLVIAVGNRIVLATAAAAGPQLTHGQRKDFCRAASPSLGLDELSSDLSPAGPKDQVSFCPKKSGRRQT